MVVAVCVLAWYNRRMAKVTNKRNDDRARKGRAHVLSFRFSDVDGEEVKKYQSAHISQELSGWTKNRSQTMAKRNTGRTIKVHGGSVDYSLFNGVEFGVKSNGIVGMVELIVDELGQDVQFDFGEDFTAVEGWSISTARKVANDLRKEGIRQGYKVTPSHEGEDTVKDYPSVWAISYRKLTDADLAEIAEKKAKAKAKQAEKVKEAKQAK